MYVKKCKLKPLENDVHNNTYIFFADKINSIINQLIIYPLYACIHDTSSASSPNTQKRKLAFYFNAYFPRARATRKMSVAHIHI